MSRLLGAVCLGALVAAAVAAAVTSKEYSPVHTTPAGYDESAHAGRVIVKFKAKATTLSAAQRTPHSGPQAAALLGARLGVALVDGRILGERTQVLKSSAMNSSDLAVAIAKEADVEWVEIDHRRFIQTAPNDPLYPNNPVDGTGAATTPLVGQWYLRAPTSTFKSAINIEPAWAVTHGSSTGVVIADVDTGITSHPDLQNKLFTATFAGTTPGTTPYGYDFVGYDPSETDGALTANDGGGADPDPSDPGDWITAAEDAGTVDGGTFKGCGASGGGATNSSWHGTQTAGILGAQTNNGVGMAGVGYDTMIVPVRALGKCGGYDSDIIAAAEWAGGLTQSSWVDGTSQAAVPTNIHPARVINMSLGGTGSCGSDYRDALTALRNAGVVVVAAAGNDEGLAVGTPANCQPASSDANQTPIVVAVAGLRQAGTKVGYSDIGPQVTIAAPAGNCINTDANTPCLYPIATTANTGTTVPVAATYTSSYGEPSLGTSFSTPLVAGTVALMMSAAPTLTNAQIISLLKTTSTAFPTVSDTVPNPATCTAPTSASQDECICTTTTCGAGMLNAGAAVTAAAAAAAPVATITGGTTLTKGSTLQLSGASSTPFTGATITSYQWTLLSGASAGTLSGNTGSSVTLTGVAAGTVVVQLTTTDSAQSTATTTASITVNEPAASSGGGAASPGWLLALLLGGALLAPRRRSKRR